MPFQAETIISIQAFIDMPADDLDQIEDQVVVFRLASRPSPRS